MGNVRMTNWLLLGIFVALVAQMGVRLGAAPVLADTLKLDQCITAFPDEKPSGYVHVVTHTFARS